MPALNFKEIPRADEPEGQQDSFEFLARDFLAYLGYRIVSGPDRGPDGGRDLVVEEVRTGVGGETRLRWLVSCKHKAHGGGSVGLGDEPDIGDRLKRHGCTGFIEFSSTTLSSGLSSKLDGLGIDIQKFDSERIETELLRSSEGLAIAARYFPKSIKRWKREHPQFADIMVKEATLRCDNCGRDLLTKKQIRRSIIVVGKRNVTDTAGQTRRHVQYLYYCCKGSCDRALQARYRVRGIHDGWEDLDDIYMPTVYLKWVMVSLNELQSGVTYEPAAFEKLRDCLGAAFFRVARSLTTKERERVRLLLALPSFLGGLG